MTEQDAFERMKVMDAEDRVSYANRGRVCSLVRKQMLHLQRINPETNSPCTLTEWIRLCSPWGYAESFQAMRDFESLNDIPMDDLAQMPKANIQTLTQLSTAVRSSPGVLSAAKTQRPEQFIDTIRRNHPGQAIEHRKPLRFMPTESQAADIEEAIKIAMEEDGAMSRTEAIWAVCIDYRAGRIMAPDMPLRAKETIQ